jgi:hypothetical protein
MRKKIELTEWEKKELENMKHKTIYANIVSVSRSGMRRKMSFYYIHESELIRCTWVFAKICNYKLDKNGYLSVYGAGMDMVFSVLSNFNYAMAQYMTGKTLTELLDSKECGTHIYDKYYIDANNYRSI